MNLHSCPSQKFTNQRQQAEKDIITLLFISRNNSQGCASNFQKGIIALKYCPPRKLRADSSDLDKSRNNVSIHPLLNGEQIQPPQFLRADARMLQKGSDDFQCNFSHTLSPLLSEILKAIFSNLQSICLESPELLQNIYAPKPQTHRHKIYLHLPLPLPLRH